MSKHAQKPVKKPNPLTTGQFWKHFLIGLGFVVPLGAFKLLFVFFKNLGDLPFSYFTAPLLQSILYYVAAYVVVALITRRPSPAAIISGGGMLAFMNFGVFLRFFMKLGLSQTVALILVILAILVLVILLGLIFLKLLPKDLTDLLVGVIALVFLAILLLNTVLFFINSAQPREEVHMGSEVEAPVEETAAPVPEAEPAAAESTPEPEATPAITAEEIRQMILSGEYESSGLPNFYFFIFDEMAGLREVETYYDYDTSALRSFLDANNFNYSADSECIFRDTHECITDLMGYTPWYGKNHWAYDLDRNAPIRITLESLGYSLYSATSDATIFSCPPNLLTIEATEDSLLTIDGQTTGDLAFENSLFSFLQNSRSEYTIASSGELLSSEEIRSSEAYAKSPYKKFIENALTALDYYEDPDNIVPYAGMASFIYTQITHTPFVFRADGSILENESDSKNWSNKDIYTGLYDFSVAHMELMISNILENDPDCVIIIMSDHGVRYHDDGAYPFPEFIEYADQKNIVNFVYYRGQEVDISALSPFNTIRVVLNLMGADLPLLDDVTMQDVMGADYVAPVKESAGN